MAALTQSVAQALAVNSGTLSWANPYGGLWSTVANWQDMLLGTVAATAPTSLSTVIIAGGAGDNFTNIAGTGSAAQMSISGDVLLWGTVGLSGGLTSAAGSELDLDGGASISAAGLTLATAATMSAVDNSSATITSTATLANGTLLAASGSSIRLGGLVANGLGLNTGLVAVDDSSSIEIGSTGNASAGAITIDKGQSAAISGALDGNVVVNGTLAVQAGGMLAIDQSDPFGSGQTIAGTGTLQIGEGSELLLGVADSAAIRFAAPAGTLVANSIPTGQISGFASGDTITLAGLATGLRFTQTTPSLATLTLLKGAAIAGKLTLAGNYTTSLFHIRLTATGTAYITLQATGIVPVQPSLLSGTAGSDSLTATANNQTLTGLGGNDTLSGGTFNGITFSDSSASLNGSTITAFALTDTIDLVDVKAAAAVATFTPAVYSASGPPVPATLVVNDGTHSATMTLAATVALPAGVWSAGSDGTGGTALKYIVLNTDAYAFTPLAGDSVGVAGNWRDTTLGATATAAPGLGNAVTLMGGSSYADVGGTGVAASMSVTGDILLLGTVNVGSATLGTSGALTQNGTLALDTGASLQFGGTATVGGLLLIGGGSKFAASGLGGAGASIVAVGGSTVQFGTVTSVPALTLATDAASSIELGTAGKAKAGSVTVDAGITASLGGTIDSSLVVNGTLVTSGRSLTVSAFGQGTASVSGSGLLMIDGGGTLTLGGSDSTAIQFTQSGGTLALGSSLPTGVVSGFGKGDAITIGRPVTAIAYSVAGTLSFLNAGTTIGTMTIAGQYAPQQFQLLVAPTGLSGTVVCAPVPNAIGGGQISTGNDSYGWTGSGGGAWSNAASWIDSTTGRTPAAAPGAGDPVVIQGVPGSSAPQIITGPGAAASLQIYGSANTILAGTFGIGGQFYVAGAMGSGAALVSGAQLTAASFSDYSSVTISGGSTLAVSGAGGGSTAIVGGLAVIGGSTVRANGGVDIGGGTLGVDATSMFEAGSAGAAAIGAVTIDAGQTTTIEENGTIAARLIVNGLLNASNATIQGFGGSPGTISGTGTIVVGTSVGPGRLTLRSADSATLLLSRPGDILEIQGALPTGAIGGFAGPDTIQIDRAVTGISFMQTNGLQGTLTLTNGGAAIGSLTLLGNYAGSQFQLDVAAPTGFGTISLLPTTVAAATSVANLTVGQYTLLAGQTTVSGTLAVSGGTLALAGATLAASTATISGVLEAGATSSATIASTATLSGGSLEALNGSTMQLGGLLGGGSGNVLAVDGNSSIRIGSSSAVAGAVTVGAGNTAVLNGSIYGNVVVNGTLAAPGGGSLFIDMTGTAASNPYDATSTIGGTGVLAITQGGTLALGAIDTATIQFNGPNATLALGAIPSGKINGFYAGDQIVLDQTLTGVSYTQVTPTAAVLSLRNGTAMVGTLNLTGNFTGSLFHLDPAANGASATITLQTLGLAAMQPTLIQGTNLPELLTATANGQTITGGGGSDTLNGAGFGSLVFKDTTANTAFDTIQNFAASDIVDLIDLKSATATVKFTNGTVAVSDGTRSGSFALSFAATPATGTFHVSSDGGSGTKLTWS